LAACDKAQHRGVGLSLFHAFVAKNDGSISATAIESATSGENDRCVVATMRLCPLWTEFVLKLMTIGM